jgi:hypothetical protein
MGGGVGQRAAAARRRLPAADVLAVDFVAGARQP